MENRPKSPAEGSLSELANLTMTRRGPPFCARLLIIAEKCFSLLLITSPLELV